MHSVTSARLGQFALLGLTLALVAAFGWYATEQYVSSRQRLLMLKSDEPLAVDILPVDSAGPPLVQVHVSTRRPVELPAGRYDLRIIGRGEVGDTLTVDLDETLTEIDVDQKLSHARKPPWRPNEGLEQVELELVDLGTKWGVVEFTREGISLWDAEAIASAKPPDEPLWRLDLENPPLTKFAAPGWNWPEHRSLHPRLTPFVVREAADLDGDGVGDVLLAGAHQCWMLAASGATGRVLWLAARGLSSRSEVRLENAPSEIKDDPFSNARPADDPFLDPPAEFQSPFRFTIPAVSQATAPPMALGDIDGDGVFDWLAAFHEAQLPQDQTWSRNWLEAFSGATGSTLWRRDLPSKCFDSSEVTHSGAVMCWGKYVGLGLEMPEYEPEFLWAVRGRPPRRVRRGEGWAVALATPHHVEWLDPSSGEPLDEPWDDRPLALVHHDWHDVDGDGRDDLVFFEQDRKSNATEMVARSLARNRELWRWQVDADKNQPSIRPQLIRPIFVDLNGDGRVDVAAMLSSATEAYETISVCSDPASGPRWQKRIRGECYGMLVGPDIDGDGWRELYVASAAGPAYVDAVSGRDGRTLWSTAIDHSAALGARQLAWWYATADGWPQLAVLWESRYAHFSILACYSAGTGRIVRMGNDVQRFDVADLDRDSLDELWTQRAATPTRPAEVRVTRGTAGVVARLAADARPLGDLDGDGVDDLLLEHSTVHRFCRSVSATPLFDRGKSDERFGKYRFPLTEIGPVNRQWSPWCPDLQAGKMGSDHAPRKSLIAAVEFDRGRERGSQIACRALAGPTGRVAWQEVSPIEGGVDIYLSHDLDGDGAEEILTLAGNGDGRLIASSSTSGERLWRSDASFEDAPHGFVDVDGDGFDDLLFISERETPRRLSVVSGRTGGVLWTYQSDRSAENIGAPFESGEVPTLNYVPGRAGGAGQIVLACHPGERTQRLLALDSATGALAWEHRESVPPKLDRGGVGFLSAGVGLRPSRFPRRPRYSALVALRDSNGEWHGAWWSALKRDVWFRLNARGECEQFASLVPEGAAKDDDAHFGLAAVDLEGDGVDELVFLSGVDLWAIDPREPTARRWTLDLRPWMTGYSDHSKLPNRRDEWTHWYFRGTGGPSRVVGVDLRRGRVDWLLPEVKARSFAAGRASEEYESQYLGPLGDETPPYFLSSQVSEKGVVIQQAYRVAPRPVSIGADARVLDERWRAWGVGQRPAPAAPGRDPRWRRRLPWAGESAEPFSDVGRLSAWRQIAAWGWRLVFATVFVVGPGWYLVEVVRRRRFSLRQLLVLPLLVGLVLTLAPRAVALLVECEWIEKALLTRYVFGHGSSDGFELVDRWNQFAPALFLFYAPPAAWLAGSSVDVVRRRGARVAARCGWLWGATLLAAGWTLLRDQWADDMFREMYYSSDGWPLIVCDGLFWAGWLTALGGGGKYVWRVFARRILGRRSPANSPAGPMTTSA